MTSSLPDGRAPRDSPPGGASLRKMEEARLAMAILYALLLPGSTTVRGAMTTVNRILREATNMQAAMPDPADIPEGDGPMPAAPDELSGPYSAEEYGRCGNAHPLNAYGRCEPLNTPGVGCE